MSKNLWMVIVNNGDGSNSVEWVKDPKVLDRMESLADAGDEFYASGDGLQKRRVLLPEGCDLDDFLTLNGFTPTTLEDLEDKEY